MTDLAVLAASGRFGPCQAPGHHQLDGKAPLVATSPRQSISRVYPAPGQPARREE